MKEVNVDVASLNNEKVEELTKFLKEKIKGRLRTKSNIETKSGKMLLSWKKDVPRPYLRLLLKKFLHRSELKESHRVISDGKTGFTLRKLPEAK